MLDLTLRPEFQSSQMPGTQITLADYVGGNSADILEITYPTGDVRTLLRAVAEQVGRPVAIVGDRGRGKSHLLALTHFAFAEPSAVEDWAAGWADDVGDPTFGSLALPRSYTPVTATMSDHDSLHLWGPLFKGMKRGDYYRGRFESGGAPVPPRSLLEAALVEQPVALILDELQTWMESLPRDAGGSPWHLAFNFIQILAEIAASRPELLRLIVSVRKNDSEAFQQVRRNNPVLIDFRGGGAREDRIRLVQHRLFSNRRQIDRAKIEAATRAYAVERIRLLYPDEPTARHVERRDEVTNSWPFSPELLDIFEDEILLSSGAQETRDLLRWLVRLYKVRGTGEVPILTPADVDVTSDQGGAEDLATAVDAVANPSVRLREVAQRNLAALNSLTIPLPRASEMINALWVRSLSGRPSSAGARPAQLHLDVTRGEPIDDNIFADELARLRDASFNIHTVGDRLVFRLEVNTRTQLLVSAKNEREFEDGRDTAYIRRAIPWALNPIEAANRPVSRVVPLGPDWETDPWANAPRDELPLAWTTPVIIVLPELVEGRRLAEWLVRHVSVRRNLGRFLMPSSAPNPYRDRQIQELARCAVLASEWEKSGGENATAFKSHAADYRGRLRTALAKAFDRLAVLQRWDFTDPSKTSFDSMVVKIDQKGALTAVDEAVVTKLFDLQGFKARILEAAARRVSIQVLFQDLMEPPARPDEDAIPYLGDTEMFERILQMVASGDVALEREGRWFRREASDVDPPFTYQRIRGPAFATGAALGEVFLALPGAVPSAPSAPTKSAAITPEPATVSYGTIGTAPAAPTTVMYEAPPAAGYNVWTHRSVGMRTPNNLAGDLIAWGLGGKKLKGVRLAVDEITTEALADLLHRCPPSLRLRLEVDVEEKTP